MLYQRQFSIEPLPDYLVNISKNKLWYEENKEQFLERKQSNTHCNHYLYLNHVADPVCFFLIR
jgi:hypothetical protein